MTEQTTICDNCTKLEMYLQRLSELGRENERLKAENEQLAVIIGCLQFELR